MCGKERNGECMHVQYRCVVYGVAEKMREEERKQHRHDEKERVGMIFVGVVGAAARTDPPCKHARETWRGRLAYHKLEVGEGGGGVGRISRESPCKVER